MQIIPSVPKDSKLVESYDSYILDGSNQYSFGDWGPPGALAGEFSLRLWRSGVMGYFKMIFSINDGFTGSGTFDIIIPETHIPDDDFVQSSTGFYRHIIGQGIINVNSFYYIYSIQLASYATPNIRLTPRLMDLSTYLKTTGGITTGAPIASMNNYVHSHVLNYAYPLKKWSPSI